MKSKFSIFLLLMSLAIFLGACQNQASKTELLTNALEAYLYAMGSGDTTVQEPQMKDLSNEEKSKVINQLTFSFVFEREDYLLSFLDRQWPEWQNDQGFIINYLLNRSDLEKQRLMPLKEEKINLTKAGKLDRLEEFFVAVGDMLEKHDHDENHLYLVLDSQEYTFSYLESALHLISASVVLVDVKESKSYACIYDKEKLFIHNSKKVDLKRKNCSLESFIHLNEDSLLPLINPSFQSAELKYTSARPFAENAVDAYFDGTKFLIEPSLSPQKNSAYLQVISGEWIENFVLNSDE